MQYKIISHEESSDVAERVNELLQEGWELKGELLLAKGGKYGGIWFAQAMILREEDETSDG